MKAEETSEHELVTTQRRTNAPREHETQGNHDSTRTINRQRSTIDSAMVMTTTRTSTWWLQNEEVITATRTRVGQQRTETTPKRSETRNAKRKTRNAKRETRKRGRIEPNSDQPARTRAPTVPNGNAHANRQQRPVAQRRTVATKRTTGSGRSTSERDSSETAKCRWLAMSMAGMENGTARE